MRASLKILSAILFLTTSAWADIITFAEARKAGVCRYESNPTIFHVKHKDAYVDLDLCAGLALCEVAGNTIRFTIGAASLREDACPLFEQLVRISDREDKLGLAEGTYNARVSGDLHQTYRRPDGVSCRYMKAPTLIRYVWRGDSITYCRGALNCDGEFEPIICPVPKHLLPQGARSLDETKCPSVSQCIQTKYTSEVVKTVDMEAEYSTHAATPRQNH